MSHGVTLTACIQPHEIEKPIRDHLNEIVRRVAAASGIEGHGHDLLLRVYLAGMYHGVMAGAGCLKVLAQSAASGGGDLTTGGASS